MVKTVSNAADNQNSAIPKTRKEKSREKEYRRAQNINGAFESLQRHIPYLKPEERKQLPKIKTLRLAMQYINHLNQLLDGNQVHHSDCDTEVRPLEHSDFRSTVASEMRVRNSYRERAHMTEMDSATVQRILAREEQRSRRYQADQVQEYTPQPFGPHAINAHNFRRVDFDQVQHQMQDHVIVNEESQCFYPMSVYLPHNVENTYSFHT